MENPDQVPGIFDQLPAYRELLPDAVALIEKDFAFCGISFTPESLSQQDVFLLRSEVTRIIHRMLSGKYSGPSVSQLLYRADVREEDLKRSLLENPERVYEELMAEKLIIRALQRVYYRKKYS